MSYLTLQLVVYRLRFSYRSFCVGYRMDYNHGVVADIKLVRGGPRPV